MYELSRTHVIAALDLDTREEALDLVDALDGVVERFKVGSKLFTAHGPAILDDLAERGAKVFLDLKYHDIPSVIGEACREAARHDGVFMMTVHALGGAEMVRRAVAGAAETGGDDVDVIAVTALTSHSATELARIGIDTEIEVWAERLGDVAIGAGATGLVCSAREVARLRQRFPGVRLVTPGIRPQNYGPTDDQTRVVRPKEALSLGSDYLVIGRPMYKAQDPREAAIAIAEELSAEDE